MVKLSETATERCFLAIYCTFRNYRLPFSCAIMSSSRGRERDWTRGTFLRVNLVTKSTEILTTAERENPIARKVEKPRFFTFEWCFPLRVMEHRVAFRAHPREKGIAAVATRKNIVVKWDWSSGIFNLDHCHRSYHANLLNAGFQYDVILMLLPILNWMPYFLAVCKKFKN